MSKILFSFLVLVVSLVSVSTVKALEKLYTEEQCIDEVCEKLASQEPPPPKKKFVAPKPTLTVPVCTPEEIGIHWEGDQGGLVVRVEKKTQATISNGQLMYGCVATRASVIALWKLFQALDGRVKGLEDWRAAFEGAVDSKGQPAPLTVQNWILVWERVNWLMDRIQDHGARIGKLEGRVKKVEETTCRLINGKYVNCPSMAAEGQGFDVRFGPRFTAPIRFGAPSTFVLGGEFGLDIWLSPKDAVDITGIAGFGSNQWSQRAAFGAEALYVRALNDIRSVRFKVGPMTLVEPNDAGNDASFFGGQLGLMWAPGGGHFYLNGGIALGAGRSMLYAREQRGGPYVRTGRLSDWAFMLAPSLALGYTFPSWGD
jgi:hypothetical protein